MTSASVALAAALPGPSSSSSAAAERDARHRIRGCCCQRALVCFIREAQRAGAAFTPLAHLCHLSCVSAYSSISDTLVCVTAVLGCSTCVNPSTADTHAWCIRTPRLLHHAQPTAAATQHCCCRAARIQRQAYPRTADPLPLCSRNLRMQRAAVSDPLGYARPCEAELRGNSCERTRDGRKHRGLCFRAPRIQPRPYPQDSEKAASCTRRHRTGHHAPWWRHGCTSTVPDCYGHSSSCYRAPMLHILYIAQHLLLLQIL